MPSPEHDGRSDDSNGSTPEEVRHLERAAREEFTPGQDPEIAQDRLAQGFGVPRKLVSDVIEAALLPENPGDLTLWGVANGLSSVAKDLPYAEERAQMQRVAGEILAAR